MNVLPFVREGLGNSSYLIGMDNGTAILIDPDRSAQRYLDGARARGWRIEFVLETHLHADFVSGAHELAAAVGAKLFLPAGAASRLNHEPVEGSENLTLGGLEVEVIASPGHTPEHLGYAVRTAAHPPALFSGGSLIVGGAARTDLISPELTEPLTRAQYRTLKTAFAELPDDTLLYPTHGGGSFCSAGSVDARTSTLGVERASNPLLAMNDEAEFARWFPTTFPATPAYYFRMRAFNQAGPRLRSEITLPPALTAAEFSDAARDAIVIDTRSVSDYSAAHIPGSLHIPLRDVFAVWLGWLVAPDRPLLFVGDERTMTEIVDECLLVGCERFAGWLLGGLEAWAAAGRPTSTTALVDGNSAADLIAAGATAIDVREGDEYRSGHVADAHHLPLGELGSSSLAFREGAPLVVYCGHGERASTAASILEQRGFESVHTVQGGFEAIRDALGERGAV